jgi:hypothetical protein
MLQTLLLLQRTSCCCLCVQGYLEIGRTTFTIIILLVRGWMVVQLWVVLQCDAHGVAGPLPQPS